MSLTVGGTFPDVPVQSVSGPVSLRERWERAPLVVLFQRLWCPFCLRSLRELERESDALRAAGGDAVVVYRQDAATVARTCASRGVAFDCFSDPEHELERAAQIRRFGVAEYFAFSPARLVPAFRKGNGRRIGLVTTDMLQGRGSYVVGRGGRIAYAHLSTSAADTPPIAEILDAVRTAAPGYLIAPTVSDAQLSAPR
jgi:peroxiredoxin